MAEISVLSLSRSALSVVSCTFGSVDVCFEPQLESITTDIITMRFLFFIKRFFND